jgi:hypothetical protein
MPVYFLSDALWEALVSSPEGQNGGAAEPDCAQNSVGMRCSFYHGCG